MVLKQKKTLVTGGSSGLGFSLAKKLLEKQADVHILGRHEEKLQKAGSELGLLKEKIFIADVTNYIQLSQVLKNADIDILINNAGVWFEGTIENNTAEQIAQVIDINLKGTMYATKILLPNMLKKNDGYILNIISTSGKYGKRDQAVYVASKFGVSGFTKSLALDLAHTNVKVAGIYPGGMNTPLFTNAANPKEISHWMEPDKVAEIVVFMLERDESMVMSELEVNRRQ